MKKVDKRKLKNQNREKSKKGNDLEIVEISDEYSVLFDDKKPIRYE